MGDPVGRGLTVSAARELGLRPGTPVGVSIIDAHAGGLGLLGARLGEANLSPATFNRRLALIGGTSTCHMAVSPKPRYIHGIWGPYFSAMIPDFWLTEGGQSATGALIDHVIVSHAAAEPLQIDAKRKRITIYELLNERLDTLARAERVVHPAELTRELHVQPDFHGNRSPRADATLKGAICGLTLSATADDLARQYLAAVQAVAYGTRHIVEELNRKGYAVDTLLTCGGGTKNPVFLREHADITGCRLVLPREPEAVLLGSALLGAVAGGAFPSVLAAMSAMNAMGKVINVLDRLGLADNTIIVFLSDHGYHLGEHDLWCKTSNYELDTRTPFMVVAPGVTGTDERTSAMVELLDLYPTLVQLCGLPPAFGLEGQSLVPILRNPSLPGKPVVISQHPHPSYRPSTHMGYALRTPQNRYVEWRDLVTGAVTDRELYDEIADPKETTNHANDPAYAAVQRQLAARAADVVAAGGRWPALAPQAH
jgi:hypothetical protein